MNGKQKIEDFRFYYNSAVSGGNYNGVSIAKF